MWADLSFHTRVLLEVTILAGLSAFIGTHVLDRKLSFLTHALGHATFPGIALAAAVGAQLAVGGFAASCVVIGVLALLTRRRPHRVQATTGLLLAAGFALGTALTSAFLGNTTHNLEAFLVGQIVNVSDTDLVVSSGLLVVAAALTLLGHRRLTFSAFDPEGYRAAGHRPAAMSAGARARRGGDVGAGLAGRRDPRGGVPRRRSERCARAGARADHRARGQLDHRRVRRAARRNGLRARQRADGSRDHHRPRCGHHRDDALQRAGFDDALSGRRAGPNPATRKHRTGNRTGHVSADPVAW